MFRGSYVPHHPEENQANALITSPFTCPDTENYTLAQMEVLVSAMHPTGEI